jgi:2-dehydro-3-deoxygluconokinase
MTSVQYIGQRRYDVVTLGEPLVCLTAPCGRLQASRTLVKSVAGAESNLAIGLARLGRSVAMVTRVGDDPFGDEVVRTLRGEGVDTTWVGRETGSPTGLMIKERRGPDDIHVYYYRHGSAAASLTAADVPEEAVRHASRVHITGITLALGKGPREAVTELLGHAAKYGVPVSFDPNFRLKLWSADDAARACSELLPAVSDLLVGEEELLAMSEISCGKSDLDGALAWLERFNLRSVVVKRGAEGVVGVDEAGRITQPAFPVGTLVDTVGAGDAFNAGFMHSLLAGDGFEASLDAGRWVASRVVSHVGDYEGLPERAEYDAYRDAEDPIHR